MRLVFPVVASTDLPRAWWRRYTAYVQDALLVVLSAVFFKVHLANVVGGRLTSIPFAIEQGFLVGIFLCRRRSMATSSRPLDWLVAAGGWLPFAFRPTDAHGTAAATIGMGTQVIGLALTVGCYSALGRSFGVVAANRGLKTGGPYRLVRHPIYFAHFVTLTGFVVANFQPYNVALLAAIAAFQLLRIRAEERVLTETDAYAEYRQRVRWRLIPGVY